MTSPNSPEPGILELFPTPVYITNINHHITHIDNKVIKNQKNYLLNIPRIQNMGNLRSEDGYILNNPLFSNLKNFIQQNINSYVEKLYPGSNIEAYMTQS